MERAEAHKVTKFMGDAQRTAAGEGALRALMNLGQRGLAGGGLLLEGVVSLLFSP